jgi:outer membrane lipoprotein-sorting protein
MVGSAVDKTESSIKLISSQQRILMQSNASNPEQEKIVERFIERFGSETGITISFPHKEMVVVSDGKKSRLYSRKSITESVQKVDEPYQLLTVMNKEPPTLTDWEKKGKKDWLILLMLK